MDRHTDPARTARLDAHLRARIARRYRTIAEILRIGPLSVPFTRIREPDTVLDQIVEEEDRREKLSGVRRSGDDLHLPYWAELWESSLGLGQYLAGRIQLGVEHHHDPPDVLDLGCGMGLAGTIAAAYGCRVMLADLEAPALLFARLNTLPYADRTRVRQLDWRRDGLTERFELILGADVLYERKQWDFLEPFWRRCLTADGCVLLGEPGRQTGDVFPNWIRSRGWVIECSDEPVATRSRPIRIFRIEPR